MKDIWPSNAEIRQTVESCITREMFVERYGDVFKGPKQWQIVGGGTSGKTYDWVPGSTYVKNPPFFEGMSKTPEKIIQIKGARSLALLGDSVTTDHISPAGAIKTQSPAGDYLMSHQISPRDFNSFGARRGNHEIMMRGTFGNIRIKNLMLDNVEGGYTKYMPGGEQMSIYDAAMKYQEDKTPLIVIAGQEYGTGSSRDWAAKGTRLLGVRAVIAESFERIHRSNLVGMGVLPLVFKKGTTREGLHLDGSEIFDLTGFEGEMLPGQDVKLSIHRENGKSEEILLTLRIDTLDEVEYYKHGGILHYVLRQLAA